VNARNLTLFQSEVHYHVLLQSLDNHFIGNIPQFRDLPTQLPSSHIIFHVVFSPMILAMQLKVTSVPSGKLESDNKNEAYLQGGKGKAVPLQAWSGPDGPRKLRFPDYMTTAHDGGKVVSLTHRPPLPPGNAPGTQFCLRLSRLQGHSVMRRIMSMKNSNDTIWNRTSDLIYKGEH
jgi:hypothetical protein